MSSERECSEPHVAGLTVWDVVEEELSGGRSAGG
jgi:hypothetical protein